MSRADRKGHRARPEDSVAEYEKARGDDPTLASYLRIEERELRAADLS